MGTISKKTFKRLFLLYTIGQFKDGVYGKLRLNKIVYFILRNLKSSYLIPFEFKHDHYGQHSADLDNINEQLLSMNYVKATDLTTEEAKKGNRYSLTDKKMMTFYRIAMSRIYPKMKKKIDEVVRDYGYLPEKGLRKQAHCDEKYFTSEQGDTLLEENLSDKIKIDLPEDDCEDLELSLDPNFISAMRHL